MKKKIWYFAWFIEVAKDSMNSHRMEFMQENSHTEGIPISRVLSTNYLWEGGGIKPHRGMLTREFLLTTDLILLLRPPIMRIKRKGDRGYPFHIPMEGEKVAMCDLFSKTEKEYEEVKLRIQLI